MKIVNMQMNNILILINSNFVVTKEKEIVNVTIMIKSRDDLDSNISFKFNDTVIERLSTITNIIYLRQITQLDHF